MPVEVIIYEQAVVNYQKYLQRCIRRAEEARAEALTAANELIAMQRRLDRLYAAHSDTV